MASESPYDDGESSSMNTRARIASRETNNKIFNGESGESSWVRPRIKPIFNGESGESSIMRPNTKPIFNGESGESSWVNKNRTQRW